MHPLLEGPWNRHLSARSVLCVDDEDAIRRLLESALEHFGYTALVAGSGREALRLAAQHWIDAVIHATACQT